MGQSNLSVVVIHVLYVFKARPLSHVLYGFLYERRKNGRYRLVVQIAGCAACPSCALANLFPEALLLQGAPIETVQSFACE
jgi:hypothetical protein